MFGRLGLNFGTVFGQFRVEILGFYTDCPNIILEIFLGVFRLYGKSLESII